MRVGKISGAVGVAAHFSPNVEEKILKSIGLKREKISTQVLPRDHFSRLHFQFALIGASIERMALEIRHLSRSEVSEVCEGFSKKQKGSSAMPHKRNPISSENLMGISRILRSYVQPSIENISLWHERDISHSSVERVILPDAFSLTHYSLQRMTNVIENLDVRRERVTENLKTQGSLLFSGHLLLELTRCGANREEAYRWIQSATFEANKKKEDPLSHWMKHPEILKFMNIERMKKTVSLETALKNVDAIYQSVL